MNQKIGHNFDKYYIVDLLPFHTIKSSYSEITIDWFSYLFDNHQEWNSTSYIVDASASSTMVIVGSDVYSIEFKVKSSQFFSSPLEMYRYTMRMDRVIMLNILANVLNPKILP